MLKTKMVLSSTFIVELESAVIQTLLEDVGKFLRIWFGWFCFRGMEEFQLLNSDYLQILRNNKTLKPWALI